MKCYKEWREEISPPVIIHHEHPNDNDRLIMSNVDFQNKIRTYVTWLVKELENHIQKDMPNHGPITPVQKAFAAKIFIESLGLRLEEVNRILGNI